MPQAAGSWSEHACCAVHGNECGGSECYDRTSTSNWLFRLWPGPPQYYGPKAPAVPNTYQIVDSFWWPKFASDLAVGTQTGQTFGEPGGTFGYCRQGKVYEGTSGEICGGNDNWGATDVEVWYPV